MKIVLLIVCLLCGNQLTLANLFSWSEGQQPNHDLMQGDDPESSEGITTQIQSLLQAMKVSFVELSNKRNSWFDHYNLLAQAAVNKSAMIDELLFFSRTAMPIIWTSFMANGVRERAMNLQNGNEVYYTIPDPNSGFSVDHPLQILPTQLTEKDNFVVEVGLVLYRVANFGIRLMFEPKREDHFDWNEDDIFLDVDFKWDFERGKLKEVQLSEKYNSRVLPGGTVTPYTHSPNLNIEEKFLVVIVKEGDCFSVFTLLGEAMYVQIYKEASYNHEFCPKGPERSEPEQEPKRLRVVINEGNTLSAQVEVHSITWYPTNQE